MMRRRSIPVLLLVLIAAGCARDDGPSVDREADRLLHAMSDLLAETPRFSVAASEIRDVMNIDGNMSQDQLEHRAFVERPNRIRREVTQGDDSALLIYDSGALAVHTTRDSFYASTQIPATLDDAMDYLFERLDARAPLADLFYSSPYDSYVDSLTSGQYVGEETVEGTACHHLAFQHPALDFDIWVADGDRPLPCKLTLSYKLDEGAPKSVLTFRDWDLDPTYAADFFAYRPPDGYVRIPFIGVRGDVAAAPGTTPATTPDGGSD